MSTDAVGTVTTANSYAAIDLGSNSFHMVIAEPEGESIRIIDSLRHPVRLASGLDDEKNITESTQAVALETLARFGQRLRGVQRRHIRIVGTNTLRRAKNADSFMHEAGKILGKDIEIISGREEARLIYSAVSHTLPDPETQRLVVDIGGGSTELIVGTGQEPFLMESVNMGCVSYSQRFINGRKLSLDDWERATMEAQLELQPIKRAYRDAGWTQAIGCSGTIKATSRLLVELGISDGEITRTALKELRKQLITAGSVENLVFESISRERNTGDHRWHRDSARNPENLARGSHGSSSSGTARGPDLRHDRPGRAHGSADADAQQSDAALLDRSDPVATRARHGNATLSNGGGCLVVRR